MPLIIPSNSQSASGYTISQSIRFNDDDSAYLSRTPSSEGNRKKWTLSTWFKLGNSGINNNFDGLFSAVTSASAFVTIWVNNATYNLDFIQYNGGTTYRVNTPLLTRDPAAWYHAVFVYDSGNSLSTERMRIYLNGLRVTDLYQEAQPSLNYDSQVNATSTLHNIGRAYSSGVYSTYYFDGYQTEIHLLDGYAYDPSNFGEFNDSGIWIPKEYTGSYGTNGFKIDGRDSSDLGDDESGNGNDYTTSGLASDDQQPDSPTNNHCTWNPIEAETLITYSNGNLAIAYSGNSARNMARSTIQIPASTDAFFEMVMTSNLGSGVDFAIGIEDGTAQSDNSNSIYNNAYVIREDGNFIDQSSSGSYGVSFTNTDVIGVWRKANGDLVFYKNGTAMNSGTPAKTGLTGTMFFVAGPFNGASAEARFASSKWTNKPSGVTDSMALNTSNLGS
ncbi:MAG: hypothetical protein CMP44_02995 [Rickettsiales bacterium]|nr:hypothetical protein [Rickettsiales bacterium]